MITKNDSVKSKGFTLIELLVVVAIIGLLASIITSSVSISRIKARDSRRVTDLKQVKTGMDLFFQDARGYPDTAAWVAGAVISCNGETKFQVPKDPIDPLYQYTYTASGVSISGCGTTVRQGFNLRFYIENKAKWYLMDEDGNLKEEGTNLPVSFDSLL